MAKATGGVDLDHGENMDFPFEGRKQNKHSLRQLLLEEVELFEAADQQLQEEARAEHGMAPMGRGAMPPPSPR